MLLGVACMGSGGLAGDTACAMAEENVKLIRESFAAWERGDLDWLDRHTDPQVEIAQPPNLPGTSTYTGKEGMREALRD